MKKTEHKRRVQVAQFNQRIAFVMGMTWISCIFSTLGPNSNTGGLTQIAHAHGFNANRVHISRQLTGKYRVTIKYTHVELGEYREAHIDFNNKNEAIKAYQDLAQGADFFLGDIKKSLHFHNPSESNKPY